jgi:hypothetical protein
MPTNPMAAIGTREEAIAIFRPTHLSQVMRRSFDGSRASQL